MRALLFQALHVNMNKRSTITGVYAVLLLGSKLNVVSRAMRFFRAGVLVMNAVCALIYMHENHV